MCDAVADGVVSVSSAYLAAAAAANAGSPHTCFATKTASCSRSDSALLALPLQLPFTVAAGSDDCSGAVCGRAGGVCDRESSGTVGTEGACGTVPAAAVAPGDDATGRSRIIFDSFTIAMRSVARVNHLGSVGVTSSGSKNSSGLV